MQYKKLLMQELIPLAQKNDIKALEEIIKREQKNVFTTFSYLVQKRENVSDLTQETLLKLAKNISRLKNANKFKKWLNQIIINVYNDYLRKKKHKPEVISLDYNSIPIIDKKCGPNEKCLSIELENIITSAIQGLPEQYKIVIILRELQGLTYEEIANITKSNIGTVKSRISRARLKLQTQLESYI